VFVSFHRFPVVLFSKKTGIMRGGALLRVKARTPAVARGERRVAPGGPKVWFTSTESFAKILSASNRALLHLIVERAPESLQELAEIAGRAKSNLSRTLRTMEHYGLVRLDRDEHRPDGTYVTVHAQGAAYPSRELLAALERRLGGKWFVRVHRGYLVYVDRIREFQPWDGDDCRIVLQDGSCVNLSRRYRSRLAHLLQ
jgi:predicted transcriptional regulator